VDVLDDRALRCAREHRRGEADPARDRGTAALEQCLRRRAGDLGDQLARLLHQRSSPDPRIDRRCAKYTGIRLTSTTANATTLTCGRAFGSRRLLKIHFGSVIS